MKRLAYMCLASLLLATTAQADRQMLRVCADPNNMPFSNKSGEGFENHLAKLVGNAMGREVEYIWWAQRRGFIRNTLNAGRCDLVVGIPSASDQVITTHPYYRSSYVLVYRKDKAYALKSLDDPQLRTLKIGIHLLGDGTPPPALALARRGIVRNVVGYSIFGDYRTPNPPARLIEAVARGDVDVAIAWGPLAGYFAQHSDQALEVVPLPEDSSGLPFRFSISMGVRHEDTEMKDRLNAILDEKRPEIQALLTQYGVPLVENASMAESQVKESPR